MTELLEFDLSRPKCDPTILLDGGPPRALYKVNPRLIFGQVWWDEVRRWAYAKFNNTCAACGARNTKLEAHELYNVNKRTGKVTLKDVVPLCWKCHSFIHQDLHRSLLFQGTMKSSQVAEVLQHGKKILAKYKIKCLRRDPNCSKIKDADWRLVLNGEEYGPIPKGENKGK